MKYTFPQIVFGFHGCDRTIGEAVLNGEKKLRSSTNSYDWLGHGVYFWENAPMRALQWAKECMENPKKCRNTISEPFVIGAVINVGHCLNLTATESIEVLQSAHQYLQTMFETLGKEMPKNDPYRRSLDCAVINATEYTNQMAGLPPFDTVRGAFIEGDPIYPGAMLYKQTHIQICVRNTDCICGYFRPAGLMET